MSCLSLSSKWGPLTHVWNWHYHHICYILVTLTCRKWWLTEWSAKVITEYLIENKFAFGSNNTGGNSIEFWFIVFKAWLFLWGAGGPDLEWVKQSCLCSVEIELSSPYITKHQPRAWLRTIEATTKDYRVFQSGSLALFTFPQFAIYRVYNVF